MRLWKILLLYNIFNKLNFNYKIFKNYNMVNYHNLKINNLLKKLNNLKFTIGCQIK